MNFRTSNLLNTLIFLNLMIVFSANTFAQRCNFNYQKQWKTIDSLFHSQLPESAIKLINEIHQQSMIDKNQVQQIKAFVMTQQALLDQNESLQANPTELWANEYSGLTAENKALLYSYQASFLTDIFRRERYKIFDRSKGATDPKDIATWDASYFNAKIDSLYQKSLESPDLLAAIPSINYQEFTDSIEIEWSYRPSLLDLLAWKALDFYRGGEFDTNPIPLPWTLDKNSFKNFGINNGGKVTDIFNLLEKTHLLDKDRTAHFYISLERLKYIYEKSELPNKETYYSEALKNLKLEAGNLSFKANIIEEEANLVYQLAENYLPDDPKKEKYRFYISDAAKTYQSVIDSFPDSQAAVRCSNKLNQIRQPNISIQSEKIIRKGKPFFTLVNYTNFERLEGKIFKINSAEYLSKIKENNYRQFDHHQFSSARLVNETSFKLKQNNDFRPHATETAFKALAPGRYILEMTGINKNDTCATNVEFTVSGMTFCEDQGLFTVMDFENGQPLKGAIVTTSSRENINQPLIGKTNSEGKTFIPRQSSVLQISLNGDTLTMPWYIYNQLKPTNTTIQNLHFFTDRSVYRMGQKVFFKGILLNSMKDSSTCAANQEVQIIFRNSNYQPIDTLQLITNRYGSVTGVFSIPGSGMPGNYYIQSSFGNEEIRVESYRRPGFEVKIDPIEGEFRLGSEVKLTGGVKSFSGVTLQTVIGKYRINRSPHYGRWQSNDEEIKSGTFTTDDSGKFSISFVSEADSLVPTIFEWPSQFKVEIEVTDISGETQTESKSFTMGKNALKAVLTAPDFYDLSKNKTAQNNDFSANFSIVNSDFQPIKKSGKIELIRLKLPHQKLLNREWTEPDSPIYTEQEWNELFPEVNFGAQKQPINYEEGKIVSVQNFENSDKDSVTFSTSDLISGYYKVKLLTSDQFGEQVMAEQVIRVMQSDQKKFAFPDLFWSSISTKSAQPGEKVDIAIGGAGSHQWTVQVMKDDSILSTFNRFINQKLELISIPVGMKEKGRFSISVSSVYKGKYYSIDYNVDVPSNDKKLKMEIAEFPGAFEPGKPVEWKVKVTDSKGHPVKAELAGVVYDASLDKIVPHNWVLGITHRNFTYRPLRFPETMSWGYGNCYRDHWLAEKNINLPEIRNLYGAIEIESQIFAIMEEAPPMKSSNIRIRGALLSSVSSAMPPPPPPRVGSLLKIADDQVYDEEEISDKASLIPITQQDESNLDKVEVRSDFRETAWFEAQFETDDNGEAIIHFTLPESVTQWKLMSLAHTTNAASGTISELFTAKKKLMIEPFATRFLKVGDMVHLPVKVSNLSGTDQNIRLEMKMIEMATGNPIDSLGYQATINLPDNKSEAVDWKLTAPMKPGIYKIRITAQGNHVSDGYETILPVEPAKMWVNESLASTVKPKSSSQYDLKNLGSSTKTADEKWEINLFTNPLGLVLDALPQLLEAETNTSTGNLIRLRGAVTLRKILVDHPEIGQWMARQRQQLLTSPDSFKTALENAEKFTQLKLGETPWLSGSEYQKEKLRKFDPDSIKNVIVQSIEKLENAQLPDGGFSWCPGMSSSRWMTIQVLENIAEMRTDQLLNKTENDRFTAIAEKAMNFLDHSIKSEYRKMNDKQKENYTPGSDIIDWLYARGAFPEVETSKEMKTILDFYLERTVKNRLKVGLWQQLQIAFLLKRNGDDKLAQNMLDSFTERAVKNKETGMFWKRQQGTYFYREPDIAFQSRMIQFNSEMGAKQETIDVLKTWLLQQKRTHAWSSAFATSKAVSVLLSGIEQPITGIVAPKILLDGRELTLPEISDPSGHIYLSLNPSEIRSDSKLEIINNSNSLIFGGLFHGYFKEDNDLSRLGGPLKIRKEIFSLERTARGDSLLTDFTKCQPGDLLKVRLLIETDRDLGFVSLTDQRPAGTESVNTLSQYEYNSGLWYYRANSDNDTKFFINDLSTGRYMLEYVVRVSHQGIFSGGRANIQCSFAPEFGANHGAGKIRIGSK